MPTEVRNYFVIPDRLENEIDSFYLERVLRAYDEYRISYLGEDCQGHNQVISISEAGSYDVLIRPEHRITYVFVEVQDGMYTFDFKLNVDSPYAIRNGDMVEFYLLAPTSMTTIRVLDQDDAVIYTKMFNATGTDSEFKKFIAFNQQWRS